MPETSGCGLGLGGLDIGLGIVLSGSSQFDPLGDHLTVPVRHVSRHQFARLQQKRPGIVGDVEDT